MLKSILKWLAYLGIMPVPPGMTPDAAAAFSLIGLMANINAYAEGLVTLATSGTNITLTAAQVLAKNIVLTSGASGGFTITLPATTAIMAALGNTIPLDGSFWFPLYITNQGIGQTGTLTAGDSSTTVSATGNSIASNISAKWMVQVTKSASTGLPLLTITRVFGGTN